MTTNDDGLLPSRYGLRYALEDNRLTEYCTSKNVANGSVRAPPHLLKVELLDTSLIWGDSGAFNAHAVLQDGLGRFNRDLVTCL